MNTRIRDYARNRVSRINFVKFVILVVAIPLALFVVNDLGMKGTSIVPSNWGLFFGLIGLIGLLLVIPLAIYFNLNDKVSSATAGTSLAVIIVSVALICLNYEAMWNYVNNVVGFGWFIVSVVVFVLFMMSVIWISTDRKAIETTPSNP